MSVRAAMSGSGLREKAAAWRSHLVDQRANPFVALAVLSLFSLGARALSLNNPRGPIFDEEYYVNAARAILGLPIASGGVYSGSVHGLDPNLEHPPLGKLFIAAGIRVFGDNPVSWRLASLLFGSAALLAVYGLVRAAGGRRWQAVGVASLMALDNLFVVHGRIATLDIFVVVFMLSGVALYLRERWLLAALALGTGACVKLVGLYALPVLLLLELLRVVIPPTSSPGTPAAWRSRLVPLAACVGGTLVTYLGLLYVLDVLVTPFSNPISHTTYMLRFGSDFNPQSSGVALSATSSPWQWLLNQRPILYYQELSASGEVAVLFQGSMNPFIIFAAIPALAFAGYVTWRYQEELSCLAIAWFLGTFLLFVAVTPGRPSYLFYMLTVLPGVYVAVARLFSSPFVPRLVRAAYATAVVIGFLVLYPFRSA